MKMQTRKITWLISDIRKSGWSRNFTPSPPQIPLGVRGMSYLKGSTFMNPASIRG